MSKGLNRVELLGHIGAPPDLRFTQGGQAVLNFRMATSETYLDKDKVKRERTDWHSLVLWGPRGEALSRILDKGSQIWIEGSLRTSSYEKDGNTVWKTEINVRDIILLGGKRPGGGGDESTGDAGAHDDGEGGHQQHAGGGGYGGSGQHTTRPSTGYAPNTQGGYGGNGGDYTREAAPRGSGQSAGDFEVAFGRDKGKRISEVPDLSWLRGTLERDLADSSKERFHEKARGQLAAIDAELARRTGGGARTIAGGGGGGGGYAPRGGGGISPADEAPPPADDYDAGGFGNDDDIPF